MRIFRAVCLASMVSMVALIGAPVASAQEQQIVTFEQAQLITPFLVQVSGTAQCEPGDYVSVSVEIRQRPDNSGYGYKSFNCTQTNQTFVVDVTGGPLHPGPATLLGWAYRYGPSGYFYGQENAAIRIQR